MYYKLDYFVILQVVMHPAWSTAHMYCMDMWEIIGPHVMSAYDYITLMYDRAHLAVASFIS